MMLWIFQSIILFYFPYSWQSFFEVDQGILEFSFRGYKVNRSSKHHAASNAGPWLLRRSWSLGCWDYSIRNFLKVVRLPFQWRKMEHFFTYLLIINELSDFIEHKNIIHSLLFSVKCKFPPVNIWNHR